MWSNSYTALIGTSALLSFLMKLEPFILGMGIVKVKFHDLLCSEPNFFLKLNFPLNKDDQHQRKLTSDIPLQD